MKLHPKRMWGHHPNPAPYCHACGADCDRHYGAFYCWRCRPVANKLARLAGKEVALARARGELPFLIDGLSPCVDCGKPARVHDHRDYLRPLDVEPVCASCNVMRGPAIAFIGAVEHFVVSQ